MNNVWIRKTVKATVPPVIDALGVYDRAIAAAERAEPIWLVVMYHRVIRDPREDPFHLGMCVTAPRFRKQIEFYRNYFEPIPLSEGVRRRQEQRPMPRKAVSITFDDGYADNLGTAWPILREYGMPTTVFVTTGKQDAAAGLWWDRVICAVANTTEPELDLSQAGLNTGETKLVLEGSHRARSLASLLALLWDHDIDTALEAIARIERMLRPEPDNGKLPARLSDEEIATLHAEGVEIGAHTISHPDLRKTSSERMRRELLEPKLELERIIGRPVTGFAYPGGLYDSHVVAAVRDAGYRHAVATTRGLNRGSGDSCLIERIGAPDTGVADLKRCIATLATTGKGGSNTAVTAT